MGMDQYVYIYTYHFLGGWTSIYQLFWCSPGGIGFWPSPTLRTPGKLIIFCLKDVIAGGPRLIFFGCWCSNLIEIKQLDFHPVDLTDPLNRDIIWCDVYVYIIYNIYSIYIYCIYIYKTRLIYFMYMYIYIYYIYTYIFCVYAYIYTHYTICNLLIMNYDLMISGQDLAGSLPLCQHRHHWCFDVFAHSSDCSRVRKNSQWLTATAMGSEARTSCESFPQELHCSGNFHPWRCSLWKLYCGDFCRNGMCRMDLKNTFLEIPLFMGWGSCNSLALSAPQYTVRNLDRWIHMVSFLWARLPLCLCPWKGPSINHSWGFRSADLKTYILPCTWFVAWVFCNSWTVTGKKRILIAFVILFPHLQAQSVLVAFGLTAFVVTALMLFACQTKVWLHRLGIETPKL